MSIVGGLLALLVPPGRLRRRPGDAREQEVSGVTEPPAPAATVDPARRELRYGGVDEDVTFERYRFAMRCSRSAKTEERSTD